ncbi:hypothetical protein KCP70_20805 [Salmonella enterica subsp. enterica]|nr:hypothetical protein KCP70_20805 [Salmonella enterica subsp. enterica]
MLEGDDDPLQSGTDGVYGDDLPLTPFSYAADLSGKKRRFLPTGRANLVALLSHCERGERVYRVGEARIVSLYESWRRCGARQH